MKKKERIAALEERVALLEREFTALQVEMTQLILQVVGSKQPGTCPGYPAPSPWRWPYLEVWCQTSSDSTAPAALSDA